MRSLPSVSSVLLVLLLLVAAAGTLRGEEGKEGATGEKAPKAAKPEDEEEAEEGETKEKAAEAAKDDEGTSTGAGSWDWTAWRSLPVQEGGRYKPFDTLALETLRMLANRSRFEHPDTGEKLDPVALYLSMLFDWQGWDREFDATMLASSHPGAVYFALHDVDKWDRAALLLVDDRELREALGMTSDRRHISMDQLREATIDDPAASGGQKPQRFLTWIGSLNHRERDGFTPFEEEARNLAARFQNYQEHRMGREFRVIPLQGSDEQEWISLGTLLQTDFDGASDPSGALREMKQQLEEVRSAYRAGSPSAFHAASAAFLALASEHGPELGEYPQQGKIDLEVTYNRWVPFRCAWILCLISTLCLAVSMAVRSRWFYVAGAACLVLGFIATLVGFWMRVAVSGRAPVTNMYESVIYLGLGTAFFGLLFELIYRKKYIITAAAVISTAALLLADNCPVVLDPTIQPLVPVLRDNFWLVAHVMSITLSYAAFALALGISNITLGYYLVGSKNREAIKALSRFTYRTLQAGVLLLVIGTLLGAVWADEAWGRFWGWDPKEVWSLVTALIYLAVLHARYVGWIRNFGLAVLSVLGFTSVVMAWYGVNYVLGTGLHSYGFGNAGGQMYVFLAVLLQFAYVAIVSAYLSIVSVSAEIAAPEASDAK